MATKSYKELIVWQKAHSFVLDVYSITEGFPKGEMYGLTAQFRSAAIPVAANKAEGYVNKTHADKLRFFNISQGSIEDCSCYIIFSKDSRYIADNQSIVCDDLLLETAQPLNSYMSRIKSTPAS